MKITHSGLRHLIALPEEPRQVADWLTRLGLEVEGLEPVSKIEGNLEGLVLGTVLSCEKHPDADKLKETRVRVGEGEPLAIVCGAPNVAAGQRVVVALVGATLHPTEGDAFTIKKSKIRGVLSEGMICAEDEIGLGKSHDGIMVLDTDLPDGTPAARYFGLEPDWVYEIGLTPNRVDAASHWGVARDLRALLNRDLCFPTLRELSALPVSPFPIAVSDPASCGRYAGMLVENVAIGPSPDWLQSALRSIGLGPINNVVDITNYVLHELGQPLHAFDADALAGGKIEVRKAREGEKITLLDKSEKALQPTDLVVADAEKPLALAGIMGGLDSGVNAATTRLVLESAWFQPAVVRKSVQVHGVKSDSSFRFERGTDPEMVLPALLRVAELLLVTGAANDISFQPSDWRGEFPTARTFPVKWRNLNRLIGMELPRDLVCRILENLDIRVNPLDVYGHPGFEEEFEVTVPAYRVDVEREADIAEEVIRVYGLDNLPIDGALRTDFISSREESRPEKITVKASTYLADLGYTEIVTNSLTHPDLLEGIAEFAKENSVALLNRLSEDLGVMRQTLLFSGLEALAYNLNRKQANLKLFEVGKTYRKTETGHAERYVLGLWLCGLWQDPSWEGGEQKAGYFHLKKTIENLLTRLGHSNLSWKESHPSWLEFGQTLLLNNQPVATLGLVRPELAKRKEVKVPAWYAEVDWERLRSAKELKLKVKDVPRFPEVVRDVSVVLDLAVSYGQIEQLVRQTGKKLIRRISVFDVYQGDKIESGKKAYALSLVLQDEEQTLTDARIDALMNQIIGKLESELKGVVRR